jgi:lipopolysaccharide/colanic/teichoic acid biosynthesis glycosyltransferase
VEGDAPASTASRRPALQANQVGAGLLARLGVERGRSKTPIIASRLANRPKRKLDRPSPTASRPLLRFLARARTQLLLALIVGGLVPALLRWPVTGIFPTFAGLELTDRGSMTSLAGSTMAIALGFLTLRQLKTHPGVNSIGYVLYAFSMTYATLAVVLLFARGDYARYQLGLSFCLTVTTLLFVQRWVARNKPLRLAIIPGVDFVGLPKHSTLWWSELSAPTDDLTPFDAVVADLRADHASDWERMMVRCSLGGTPIFDVKRMSEQLTGKVIMTHLSENTLGATLHGLVYAKLKRALDILMAIFLVPGFLAAIALAAIAIKFEDGGSVFFRQIRMGYRGEPFYILKLRTMRADHAGEHFTSASDARVTRIGKYLRKYRVDEFPQIWNILKGEMGWIGPRPEAIALSSWYEAEVPFYSYRHMVRPGITGWAQVNQGNVAAVDAATEKLHYDFYYIKYLSPWLDLLITAKTVMTMLTGFGSR